jgi:tRNA 2-thiouridine synthesizing protein C
MLCIVSQPPYRSSHTLELIETAMVGAVFDFEVSVLFRDEGVWGLLQGQDATILSERTFSKVLGALPTYEINNIYACAQSMSSRGLSLDDLEMPVNSLDFDAQADLIAIQEIVIGAQA